MIALNVLIILLVQGTVTRRLSGRPETAGLRLAVLCWVAGFAVAAVTSVGPAPVAIAGVAGYIILFSLGECAYSCSFHPWLIASVPEGELVRANAMVNSMMGVGLFVGPSMGSALVGTGSPFAVWGALTGCSALVVLAVRRRRVGQPEPAATVPTEPSVPAAPAVEELRLGERVG
jgi:MFS family permease